MTDIVCDAFKDGVFVDNVVSGSSTHVNGTWLLSLVSSRYTYVGTIPEGRASKKEQYVTERVCDIDKSDKAKYGEFIKCDEGTLESYAAKIFMPSIISKDGTTLYPSQHNILHKSTKYPNLGYVVGNKLL